MKLLEILNEWGAFDFAGILHCEFCGAHQYLRDGYHDEKFHQKVIPAIHCCTCNERSNKSPDKELGISPVGHRGCIPVERKQVMVEKWVKKPMESENVLHT